MGYAMVAVCPSDVDQLPRRCAPRVQRSGFAAEFEFGALHRGAVGSMATTRVLWCCLVAHCRIIAIGGYFEKTDQGQEVSWSDQDRVKRLDRDGCIIEFDFHYHFSVSTQYLYTSSASTKHNPSQTSFQTRCCAEQLRVGQTFTMSVFQRASSRTTSLPSSDQQLTVKHTAPSTRSRSQNIPSHQLDRSRSSPDPPIRISNPTARQP